AIFSLLDYFTGNLLILTNSIITAFIICRKSTIVALSNRCSYMLFESLFIQRKIKRKDVFPSAPDVTVSGMARLPLIIAPCSRVVKCPIFVIIYLLVYPNSC
ncbi:MAG TPA: hypothetical protein VEG28_03400, partial [Dehalococcoidia bacterium]|nr:hypothetical protein [Dehalococcoidia bacterium]